MLEFTKSQQLAADCRNKISYALAMLEFADEKKKLLDEKEISFALSGLRQAVDILNKMTEL